MTLRHTFPLLCAAGALVLLGCDTAETACADGVVTSGCPAKASIKVTSVGFVPSAGKRATYTGDQAAFAIKRVDDDSPVFEGMTGDEVRAQDTAEAVRIADFTDLRADGHY